MKEHNNETSKFKWSRIFRKKWFFPAVYLVVAAILLTIVIRYQFLDNQIPDSIKEPETEDYILPPLNKDEEVEEVIDQQETIKLPLADQDKAEIVTKFYDYNADEDDQKSALIFHNNRYYQSTGIDITSEDGEPFEVLAALSGTVQKVKEDPLLGRVVILSHANDVSTYYSSLSDLNIKAGDKVKQGDVLGTAGKNIFGKDNGVHVHFEIRKNDRPVNPEAFFNQPVSVLDENTEVENEENSTDNLDEEDDLNEEKEL